MNISSTINIQDLSTRLGSFCFMLLSVGFALYHTLVLNHLIPAFLGGFFVQAAVLSLVLLLPFFFRFLKQTFKSSLYLTFFQISAFFFAAVTTIVFAYYDGWFSPAVLQSLQLLFFWLTFILVGFFFIQHPKEKILKVFIAFSALYLLYVLFFMITEGKVMLNFGSTEDFERGEVSGYQGVARSFFLIAFFCTAFIKNRIVSIFSSIGFAIILFAIGARSEFYAFLAAILAYHGLLSLKVKSSFIAIILISVFAIGLGTYFFDEISQSRQFQVFNLDESTSWNARNEFKERAINEIASNPILGNFGGHVRNGASGENAHNIIAAYSNYGLVFFLIFLCINLSILFKSTFRLVKTPQNQEWSFMFLLSFSVVLLLFTGKSVFWVIPYLMWGVFLGINYLPYNKKSPEGLSLNTLEHPFGSKPLQYRRL